MAILEGVSLCREEISSLQLLPPWRLRGDTLNYGLGLLSCYFVCDLLSIVSGGYFYLFDPHGLVLPLPSASAPAAKMFALTGILLKAVYFAVILYFAYHTLSFELTQQCSFSIIRYFLLVQCLRMYLWSMVVHSFGG